MTERTKGKVGTPAVGYARRSTDMQDRSIPDQKAYLERWAGEHGYVIGQWFIDDAISGTSTRGREAFERMVSEAENGRDFDAILCYDISRFSRGGTNETGYYLHRLQQAGVEVIFAADAIPEGDEGELIQGVKSWQARQYSVKLSRDTIRGQISNVMEKHSAPGGSPPYGYDKQHLTADGRVLRTFRWLSDGRKEEYSPDGKLLRVLPAGETVKKAKSDRLRYVPSTPDRIAIVRRIFQQSAEGYGSLHLAHVFNAEGIPSPDGAKWNCNQIRKMLKNPAYRGSLAWNKRTMGRIHGVDGTGKLRPKRKGGGGSHNNPNEDWFVVENVHEPLISPELWTKAHDAFAARRGQGGLAKTTNRSLLSGLITCKHCGWRFCGWRTGPIGGIRYRYYVDRGYVSGGKSVCHGTRIPAEALDAWVLDKVRAALCGDHQGAAAAIEAFVRKATARSGKDHDAAKLQRDLAALDKRIRATVGMLTDPTFGKRPVNPIW